MDVHALRKTGNTRNLRLGFPLVMAQRQMRHTDIKLTAVDYLDEEALAVGSALASVAPIFPDGLPPILPPTLGAERLGLAQGGTPKGNESQREPLENQSPGHALAQADAGNEKAPAVGIEPTT